MSYLLYEIEIAPVRYVKQSLLVQREQSLSGKTGGTHAEERLE